MFSLIESLLLDAQSNDNLQHKISVLTLNGGQGNEDINIPIVLNEQKDFEEQQILVARLVHLVQSEQIETHFKVYIVNSKLI